MITGFLLLVWGIGIVCLAFAIQTRIQDAATPDWQAVRALYDRAPILYCICTGLALMCWPVMFSYIVYKTFIAKGTSHGN